MAEKPLPKDGWDWNMLRRMSPILDQMIASGVPLTRENYIGANWGDIDPEDWTAEHEASLPAPFQKDVDWDPAPKAGKRG
jgi:hypothetical protein